MLRLWIASISLAIFSGFCIVAQSAWAADATGPFNGKHVMIIGLDGCRPDALQAANTPNIKSLIQNGTTCYRVYAGGKPGTDTLQETVSAPGWATIVTGVWANKHHIITNDFKNANLKKVVNGKIVGYPHFFTRIKKACPNCFLASIVGWFEINDNLLSDDDYRYSKGVIGASDVEVAQKSVELLRSNKNPDILFVQFNEIDSAGHHSEFSPKCRAYLNAIEHTDRQIGTVLGALRQRPNYSKEDWLILVTTDHGGIEIKHGGQTPEERTIFIVASGGGYPHCIVNEEWSQVTIPPTVFRHLGIHVDPKWGWESGAFAVPNGSH
jgi:predicted AlkP superfamily pyrophosphatase or phosphodiesterase